MCQITSFFKWLRAVKWLFLRKKKYFYNLFSESQLDLYIYLLPYLQSMAFYILLFFSAENFSRFSFKLHQSKWKILSRRSRQSPRCQIAQGIFLESKEHMALSQGSQRWIQFICLFIYLFTYLFKFNYSRSIQVILSSSRDLSHSLDMVKTGLFFIFFRNVNC